MYGLKYEKKPSPSFSPSLAQSITGIRLCSPTVMNDFTTIS